MVLMFLRYELGKPFEPSDIRGGSINMRCQVSTYNLRESEDVTTLEK